MYIYIYYYSLLYVLFGFKEHEIAIEADAIWWLCYCMFNSWAGVKRTWTNATGGSWRFGVGIRLSQHQPSTP